MATEVLEIAGQLKAFIAGMEGAWIGAQRFKNPKNIMLDNHGKVWRPVDFGIMNWQHGPHGETYSVNLRCIGGETPLKDYQFKEHNTETTHFSQRYRAFADFDANPTAPRGPKNMLYAVGVILAQIMMDGSEQDGYKTFSNLPAVISDDDYAFYHKSGAYNKVKPTKVNALHKCYRELVLHNMVNKSDFKTKFLPDNADGLELHRMISQLLDTRELRGQEFDQWHAAVFKRRVENGWDVNRTQKHSYAPC